MRLAIAGGVAVLALATTDATAAESVESGWWSSAPVAVAPDVPDGELLVQGGVGSEPLAYAGVTFTLADDEVPEALVLTVAEGSATTPGSTLALCRLGAPASSEDAPPFDCATTVEAAPSEDGASYQFDVAAFAAAGSLDVAVVPTAGADRVVLVAPDAGALQSGTSPSTSATGSTTSSGGTSGSGTGPSTGTPVRPAVAAPPRAPTPAAAPARTPAAPAATGRTATPAPAATPAATTTVSDDGGTGGGRSAAPFAFVGLAVAAAVLWAVAGQRSSEPTPELDAGALA